MKKLITLITTLIFLGLSLLVKAQLVAHYQTTQLNGNDSNPIEANATIVNTSSNSVSVKVQRRIIYLTSGHMSQMAWGGVDFSPNTTTTPLAETIAPGDSTIDFGGNVDPYDICGVDTINYLFFDVNNTVDSVSITFDYNFNGNNIITQQPLSQIINFDSNAQFIVTTSSTSPTYQWQLNDGTGFTNLANAGPYSGVSTSSLLVSNVSINMNNFNFRCIVSQGSGCGADTSFIALLSVCNTAIFLEPQNQTVNNGNNVQFVVASAAALFQWQQDAGLGFVNLTNAGPYNGTNSDTLSISNVNNTFNNYKFRCIVSSGTVCADTSSVAVLSLCNAAITQQPQNQNVNIGNIAHFSVISLGNQFQWQQNTGTGFLNLTNTANYSGVNTDSLSIANITTEMSNYLYRCIVSDNGVCSDTSSAVSLSLMPYVCVVTVDSSNEVVLAWSNDSANTNLQSSIIYKKTGIGVNDFSIIGVVPHADFSSFTDSTSNAATTLYSYKFATVIAPGDTMQGDSIYTSIYLTVTYNDQNGDHSLVWNTPTGFNLNGSDYVVLRSTDGVNFTDTLSSTVTYPGYTDVGSFGIYYYLVQITNPEGCMPSYGARMSTNWNVIQSNVVRDSSVISSVINANDNVANVSVFPNPSTNQLTIHTSSTSNWQTATVSIMNVLGQVALSPKDLTPALSPAISGTGTREGVASIDVSKLPAGMYFLQLKSESGSIVKKFVKE